MQETFTSLTSYMLQTKIFSTEIDIKMEKQESERRYLKHM